jgi:hypothetical protein
LPQPLEHQRRADAAVFVHKLPFDRSSLTRWR